MKGLLLKDFYMMRKYCRSYVLVAVICLAASFSEQSLFAYYPCVLCGMIPCSLLAYDERSRWLQYSGTLPYTKGQIVSGKYLIGLMVEAVMLILTGIVQGLVMKLHGTFSLGEFGSVMMMILLMSMLPSAMSLPLIFKWGVEKGRLSYYLMIGATCAMCVVGSSLLEVHVRLSVVLPILCVVVAGIYALSWYLAIVFFNKREVV